MEPNAIPPRWQPGQGVGLRVENAKPTLPLTMQLRPVPFAEVMDRERQSIASQLLGQGRADALIGLLQGFLEGDRQHQQPLLPSLEGFVALGRNAGQGWWRHVRIPRADGPNARLMVTNLTANGDHAAAFIQQQKIAVASHQLEHQGPLDLRPRARRHLEFDNALKSLLTKPHKGHLPEPMLKLLRQGASRSRFGRRWNCDQPRAVRLPAQFQPHHAAEASEAKLQGGAVRLLGLFEAAGNEMVAQVADQSLQGGQVNLLQG